MGKQGTLLIVDDNRSILTTVKMLLEDMFANIITLSNPNAIPAMLRQKVPDVVLLDMNFSAGINTGNEGLFWLREIKKMSQKTQVVLFTAYADIELAVNGIKEGATDFVVKPWDNTKLRETMQMALAAVRNSKKEPSTSPHQLADKSPIMYWGRSSEMKRLQLMVEKVASTDANILITGENGTGKEVLAREIHRMSNRADHSMMPIDMGAVSETLFESELFGSMKGAYTDAKQDRPGKFELAEGGTLFLDEIGNLSYRLQAKLLTALQRRSIMRVGGTQEIPINVRLICATNRNLTEMVAQGAFREDLLYRINTIHLHLPALRERADDIVPLATKFLQKYGDIYNKPQLHFTQEAEHRLCSLPWYGNIRELEHVIEKAVILCDHASIHANDIDCAPARHEKPLNEVRTLEEMESRMIEKTIEECDGNLSMVAQRLGISRQTLYNKIKRYGI